MFIRSGVAAAMLMLAAASASAQSFPNRTIHVIVAYAPGGTGDIVARLIAVPLAEALGQNIVIENRAGATGVIGTQAVVSAPPDGHTLLMGQTGEIAINQHWIKSLSYNAEKDLMPVALASVVPLALVVPAKAPYSTMAELATALPDKQPLTFASAGTGTPGHFAGEFLKIRTKASLTHVPYKGAGPALNDLLGGHVDMYFPGFPAAAPLLKAGTVKLLAVSSSKRASGARDIPTVAEAIKDPSFDLTLWQGFFAPAGTPPEIVARLNSEINTILASSSMQAKLRDAGADVRLGSSAQFGAFAKAESEKYQQIIKESGVKPE
ncbi:MAG: tripartite tricarboxylate transporter substrate binding protein [Alphaproteobacteria bacterium]|nr:tripartite tricarboxylate transporter substrate binding protein [Alphaproteobacteria bacterium]